MKTKLILTPPYALLNLVVLVGIYPLLTSPRVSAESTVFSTTLGEANAITPEINTEQLEKILAERSGPVLDVRFGQEYAIAHIPGSINIYEKEIEMVAQRFPDEQASMPGAVNILAGEAEQANESTDGRLPHKDKGTRVIVFATDPKDARKVAEATAQKAYWNSSFFGGTTLDLQANGLWQQKKPK